ncbi:hypothetical protein [Saccharomonospora halophila]|uniref:hypothetical protein n=1 Tax=Saccharomonospora halophila TaxID=129922 RepID=UPI00036B2AD9|nr:hypothetical protein [Saccharomonospora halophila]
MDRPEASVAEWFVEIAERYRRYRESPGSTDPGHPRDTRDPRGSEEPCDSPDHHGHDHHGHDHHGHDRHGHDRRGHRHVAERWDRG